MSLDYNEVWDRSRDVPAFSNGTEGEIWTENWCGTCLRDAPFRNMGKGSGCPIIMVTLVGRTPAEFLDGPRDEQGRHSMHDQYLCVEYKGRGGGGEPRPKPEPPQDGLFARPGRSVRMPVLPSEPVRVGAS